MPVRGEPGRVASMTLRFPASALRRGALTACGALALPASAHAAAGDWAAFDLPAGNGYAVAAGPHDLAPTPSTSALTRSGGD